MPDFSEACARYRKYPDQFVREELGVEPDEWQLEVLKAFASGDKANTRIAMQACAGPGKSAVLAWCGWNFLLCYVEGGKHPNGFAMSITSDNLKDNLWKELAVWQQRSRVLTELFEWTKERIFAKQFPSTWWLSARTFSKTADPETQGRTLSGLHAPAILYLVDESGDMPPQVLRSAEQGLANCEWGKILQAGNPTSQSGMLHLSSSEQSHLWKVVRITGDPEDSNRSSRIDIEWATQQIALYGRENPWVMAYILGKFPPSSLNSLLGPDEVRDAMTRGIKPEDYDWSQKRIGIDVARFGDDRTVLFPRQGLRAFQPVVMRGERTTAIAARAMVAKANWGSELELIDDTGHWGHGVVDNLLSAGHNPLPIIFSDPARNPRYRNRRTEMWFEMAEWIKRGGCLPNMPDLIAELTTPTYTFVHGAIALEEKDQIKKRLQRSPDLGDALALTFSIPDMPSNSSPEAIVRGNTRQSVSYEYDPLAA